MDRLRVTELHFIALVENLTSILDHGILSFDRARELNPGSFALDTAQDRRSRIYPAFGRSVHSFANVYFDAHNPTLSKIRAKNRELIVLGVSPTILDIPGAKIATQNAASDGVEFLDSPDGLIHLDAAAVYAEFWTDPDPAAKKRKGHVKCAEVLVPGLIRPEYVVCGYVCSDEVRIRVQRLAPALRVLIKPGLYFG